MKSNEFRLIGKIMESIDGYVKNKYIDKNLQINNNINNQVYPKI
jgi:hypothetical protein